MTLLPRLIPLDASAAPRRRTKRDRVRASKVLVAQARLASGYYERPEVTELVVESIWKELQRS